ncbi:hypothetical protein B0H14DRAFT_3508053 [Mycena olivaceomarginata]|nr:hypothetical protein B0H14DRAFT_3508053 [Mycena olivaceomarginata]
MSSSLHTPPISVSFSCSVAFCPSYALPIYNLAVDVGSDNEQTLEPPVVIIYRGNVTTYDLDRLRPGQAMRLVGCHKVAVPRLNEYKVPILPQVQRSVVSPFHQPSSAVSCAQVYSTINQLSSSRASNSVRIVLNADPRSFDPTIAYVSNNHTKRL